MARNQVRVLRNVEIDPYGDGENLLHLQWCRYDLEDGSSYGYRFMWSRGGRLKSLMGGARIPSWDHMQELIEKARAEGWAYQDEKNI